MDKKTKRSSIEKRFVMSILWVGVIPMMLALLIGYFVAREGQQLSVLQNLSTAASKTVDGIRLAVRERERVIQRISQMPVIVDWLREHEKGTIKSGDAILSQFKKESEISAALESIYCLYNSQGEPVLIQEGLTAPEISNLAELTRPRFLDLQYLVAQNRYAALLVTPVIDPDSSITLGYLAESQNIHELLAFMLDKQSTTNQSHYNRYEVVVYDNDSKFIVYLDENNNAIPSPPSFAPIHPSLEKQLANIPEKEQDAFFLWDYNSRGEDTPVLLAYRRLTADLPIFIAVHRPTPLIFSMINKAAAVTLLISALLIAIFCAIGYRIVNNTIIRPVSLLNEGAQIIRQGDLELKLRVDTGDEIEELASSFNQMAEALRANIHRLRSSEEKYRSLITAMRDGIFQTNENNIITFINPAGAAMLGYEQLDDLLGHPLRSLFVHEEEFEHIVGEISQEPFIESVRIWLKKKGKKTVCVEMSGIRMFGEWGELSGIDGSFRDVTRNVRLEKEVSNRAERMVAINQIVNIVNASIEAGRVYENLTREIRWLVNFDYASVSLRLDDDSFETRQLWPEPHEGHEQFPRIDSWNSCAGWVTKEKRYLLLPSLEEESSEFARNFPNEMQSCLCVPLHAEEKVIGSLCFASCKPAAFTKADANMLEEIAPHLAAAIRNGRLLENLTRTLEEVTRAREKLHEANEELKSLDEMKTNLLSNVSHELRTPLVAVMGYTDMVLNNKAGPITDTQREYLQITLRNVEKLVSLIENLLDFSRLHKGKEELIFTRFNLIDCIHTSIQSVKPVSDGRKIELLLTITDDTGTASTSPVPIEGDKGKLGQVFNNLLSNAVKFNANGGQVCIHVETRKDIVYISVTDTGIGIPKNALDKVFTRFYQYDATSTRKYGGTGIGLAIAQDIVRMHGSQISVTSTEGEGSTFRFTLPLYSTSKEEVSNLPGTPMLPTETHLLVEVVSQDRSLTAQLRNLLYSESIDIIHALYPSAAVTMAEKHNPDCILVDIESAPSGRLLLDELINTPLAITAPIIILSDNDSLYKEYEKKLSGRIKRNFRKSTVLSGIHYALSLDTEANQDLGNKILCVDDDKEIGVFMARCLENEGYEVDCCSTGEKAIELASSGQYWLTLLDIAIPDMDGWDICRRLKENGDLAGIKVYIVTAKVIDEQSSEIRDSGADGYL
ncbi:MAG: response regulator, partial [Candidatus Hydrogenedentes bacterium]|nr:response regulator [Candidatus Hydrogenedentota bacterium]